MLSGLELAAALAIVFVGATVLGTVSFGFALVVSPVLLLFLEPQSSVVTVNSLIAILLALVLLQTRKSFPLKQMWGMALGGLIAVPIGVLALNSASPATLRLIIGVVLLCLAPVALLDIRIPFAQRRMAGPASGFIASLSTTTISIGGPLAALYVISQRWPPQAMRSALAFFFMLNNIAAFPLYAQAGLVTRDALANIGILLPGLLLGFAVASLVADKLDARLFRYATVLVIVVGGVVLLARELTKL